MTTSGVATETSLAYSKQEKVIIPRLTRVVSAIPDYQRCLNKDAHDMDRVQRRNPSCDNSDSDLLAFEASVRRLIAPVNGSS